MPRNTLLNALGAEMCTPTSTTAGRANNVLVSKFGANAKCANTTSSPTSLPTICIFTVVAFTLLEAQSAL